MFIITATFDVEQAHARISELLALSDSPERLAECLGITRDLESVREGIPATSFKQMLSDVERIQKYLGLGEQIENLKADKSMLRFLGSGFKEKQLERLEEERRKFGSLIEAPRWFYRQPRVRLLSSIRDYALDNSQQDDAAWHEVEEKTLVFPIATIFEKADRDGAQILVEEIEKPLKEISPRFLLESFEGHRSLSFDFEKGVALYYAPAPDPDSAT
jgi:hypothetical protein